MSLTDSPSPSTSPNRPRRPSKFIEGTAATRPDILQRTPTSNKLFFSILSEMDAIESQRRNRGTGHSHRDSNSSVESFMSGSPPTSFALPKQKEGRRSINFGRQSLDERPREEVGYAHGETDAEKLAKKLKGRLRAWTVGKERDVKPYPGT
ncbi:hypothetical protein G7Y89_g9422 [Cudoniella acicularis]|uniref:Uncharacterized protein n=1 Tax=Cudoniella acicularis TaxID=354080 RepID=A0A8H4RID6_9HELO|nr:hypothetical protein G7Y89_g9422 [Cudoniella acicularis]